MNNTLKFYWFLIFLSCMCNLINVFSEESVPVHYKGKYSSDIKNYEIVVPQRVNKDGSFISHLVSHHHSKRSTNELDFIFYKIPIEGKDYLIELTPNKKLISPGAVVEIHREDVRKSASRMYTNEKKNNEKISKMFRDLEIRKLENTNCHFFGHVKGENTSKAALSTCYGLAGFIHIHEGFYTIEPVAEHNPLLEDAYPHILYKADGSDNSSVCHTVGELASSVADRLIRKRRESSIFSNTPLYLETLIVMDKTLINHYEDAECENYVLTVFNMAFNLFRDASSGLMMTLTLVRLIRLEIEDDEMNLKVNADAEKSLRYFQSWQHDINPGDDSHPNHHDIALLVTRVDVCYSPSACGLLGITTMGKGCDPKLSAALCEDNGLRLGYVMAHEIGHLLGADHDFINSTCNGTDAGGLKTVMHPHVSTTAQTWSPCSQAYFKEFFSSGMGNCFFDEPEEHHFNVQDLLPGVMYNANFQCKHLITFGSRECDMGSTCDSLNCHVPGYACIITHSSPAEGTPCGESMWCREGKCLIVGERPGAVDGNWGEWSAWSDCTRTCGSGVANSVRNCDKPQPSRGGKNCVGERKRYKICETTPCETGRPSFRDIQCGEFDDWIYPEDGKTHSWKGFFFHDDNPCVLYCINEEKQVAALKPRVIDGTMCFRGIRDICVAGTCQSLPCDLHFNSDAVEDACGVCHGDGTNCEFSQGIETLPKLAKGLTKLLNVPQGSRNIRVEEMAPTLAKIIVGDKDTKEIYNRGKSLGMFSVPGSQAWLGMIKKNQEALNIPGPVSKPISIWIQRVENVTVKWSMALPTEQQRKPEFAWDFLKWGPCSAICGLGTQKSEPSCMEEKAGLVENSFCADLEMPDIKVRQCEIVKCQSRWMVGDWRGCEPGSQKKERKRVVYCIKPIGEGEGESQIVADSECADPKPHEKEPCENRQKREDAEYNFLERDYSPFKPDTSRINLHKKRKVYLKRFGVSSLQRNSETVPFRFHRNFRSYLGSNMHSPNVTFIFSRDKSIPDYERLRNLFDTKRRFEHKRRRQLRFLQNLWTPNFLKKKHSENFNRVFRNLSDVLESLPSGDQSRFAEFLKENKPLKMSSFERKKLSNWETPKHSPKTFSQKLNNFLALFGNNKAKIKPHDACADSFQGFVKPDSKEFDGSGLPLTDSKFTENIENFDIQNFLKKGKSSNFIQSGKSDKRSKKEFKERHLALSDLLQEKKLKRYHRRKKFLKQKRKAKNRKLFYKQKRSNRIRKKPKLKEEIIKSEKEQTESNSETEIKNYLNNLFRDNHPKLFNTRPTTTARPQGFPVKYKRPIIKEGKLVIDKDLPQNQEMEIAFEEDELGSRLKKYEKLPQPLSDGERVVLKGEKVFYFLNELQNRASRDVFFRRNEELNESSAKTPQTGAVDQTTQSTTVTTLNSTTTTTNASTKPGENATETTTSSTTRSGYETASSIQTATVTNSTTGISSIEPTTEKNTATDESDGCDYDFGQVVLETDTTDEKKKKKKDKKKKKKDKEAPEKEKEKSSESFSEFFFLY